MKSYGTIGHFYTMNLNLNIPASSNYTSYYVVLTQKPYNKNQTEFNNTFKGQLLFPLTHTERNRLFFSELSGVYTLLVPLMAVLLGYTMYGRERITGIIESTIVRPVTKTRTMASRYGATLLSIFISVLISIGILDIFIIFDFGEFIDNYTLLLGIWGIFVESAAFLGIMYIFSHIFKAQAALLGLGLFLYVLLIPIWPLFLNIVLLSGLHLVIGSYSYSQASTIIDLVNPGSYMNLIIILTTNYMMGISNLANETYPHVNTVNVIFVGVLWIIIPLIISIYLARRRD